MFVCLKGAKQKDVLKHQKRLKKKKKKGGFDRKEGILKCNGMYVCMYPFKPLNFMSFIHSSIHLFSYFFTH